MFPIILRSSPDYKNRNSFVLLHDWLALHDNVLMLKMFVLLALAGLLSSAWASINLHDGPLLAGETSFTFEVTTSTFEKKTTCYVTSGVVSQCRRKRGMEEKPEVIESYDNLEIAPSAVLGIQPTPVPRAIHRLYPERVSSSFDDTYFKSQNIFRQLAAKGHSNKITVGDCGLSTVNLSQFLACLGMTVQETTTLTATFTETKTVSEGYTIMTIAGCLPVRFPYISCTAVQEGPSTSSVEPTTPETTTGTISVEPTTSETTTGTTSVEPTTSETTTGTTSVEPTTSETTTVTTSVETTTNTTDDPSTVTSTSPSSTTTPP
ncbi:hypothetical protein OUZ56_024825 [Daphnia magna]|uniref:Uncharacterized protein n=2 Tax=Daphnia magna TaxID=35525 RepID=A0ABQ9ZI35_9CRUS|nr:hypothetical protein OUZ56_024825 [Daphnia magna]